MDSVLRGAEIIAQPGLPDGRYDIGVRHGRIAAVEPHILPAAGVPVLDVSGHIVAPGLFDLHCHVFPGVTAAGVDVGEISFRGGVTALADAGSAGSETFPAFMRYVVVPAAERVFAFLNYSRLGLVGAAAAGELANPAYADPDGVRRAVESHPETVVGIKIRVSREVTGGSCLRHLRAASQLARSVERPLLVHIGDSVDDIDLILDELAPGDIVTHFQTPKPSGLLDDRRRVRPSARAARAGGLLFDCGHGLGHFDFEVAEALLDQGIGPDIISTDFSQVCRDALKPGLVTVMNKWLALGLGVGEVLTAVTSTPTDAVVRDADFGRIAVGLSADLAVLEHVQEPITVRDPAGRTRHSDSHLRPVMTLRAGTVVWSASDIPATGSRSG